MSLSPTEASEVLGQISRAERRSTEAFCYANASPGFILWGLVWVAGYSGTHLLLQQEAGFGINWLWSGLTLIGVAGSWIIGHRQRRAQHPGQSAEGRAIGLRWLMTIAAFWLFVIATFTVMRPVNPAATGAFVPLLVALSYAIFGIWRGLRFLFAGIAVAALTLFGFFYLPGIYLLWMAFVGGGSLILAGLWLRKV
jgi:hypothetical protein